MRTIHVSRLPADESTVRAALASYQAELAAHALTVGQPAPWPQFEILRDIVAAGGDFIAVHDDEPEQPALTLIELKARARTRINAGRDAAIASGVIYDGMLYDSDPASREALTATLTVLQPVGAVPQGFTWRAADNTDHALSLAQLQGLAAAMLDHGYTQHLRARQKKALIEAAQSVAEVAAVVWEG